LAGVSRPPTGSSVRGGPWHRCAGRGRHEQKSRGRRRHPRLKIHSKEWPSSTDHTMHNERPSCMIGWSASAHLLSEL